jgi:hypothetical protein
VTYSTSLNSRVKIAACKRLSIPFAFRLAILCQAEEVDDHLLEPLARTALDYNVRLLSGVPPVVCHPDRHVQALVQLHERLAPVDAEADPPVYQRTTPRWPDGRALP